MPASKRRRSLQGLLKPSFLHIPPPASTSTTILLDDSSYTRQRSLSAVSPPQAFLFDYPIIPVDTATIVPNSDSLLDDDPFANLSSRSSISSPTPIPPLTKEDEVLPPPPKSPLSSPPRSTTSPIRNVFPSPPKSPTTATPSRPVSIHRTASHGASPSPGLRFAYQKPAFKPRPSLPSLHALSQMNVVIPVKVRKGTVGARLPSEPWDMVSPDNSSSEESSEFLSFDSVLSKGSEDYQDIVPSGTDFSSQYEKDSFEHGDGDFTSVFPPTSSQRFSTSSSLDAEVTTADWTLSLDSGASGSENTSTTAFSALSREDLEDLRLSSYPFPSEDSPTPALTEYGADEYCTSPEDENEPSNLLFQDANPGTSAETIRGPLSTYASLRKSSSTPSPRSSNSEDGQEEVTDSDGYSRGRAGQQSYTGNQASSGYGHSGRGSGPWDRAHGGNGFTGGGGSGNGRGDDEDDRRHRPNQSSFLSTSDSDESEEDETDDYGEESVAPRDRQQAQPSESSSDDDVPLAQQIPTALRAQKTIRSQVRDEKHQRRKERALKRLQEQQQLDQQPPSVPEVISPRSRQFTLRPAGAGAPAAQPAASSSSHEAMVGAAVPVRRARTQTMPSRPAQPFNPAELTNRLAGVQLYDRAPVNPQDQILSHFTPQQKTELRSRNTISRSRANSRAASPEALVHPTHPVPPLPHSPPVQVNALRPSRSIHRLDAAARKQFLEGIPPPPSPLPAPDVVRRPRSNTTTRSKSKSRSSTEQRTSLDDVVDHRHSRPPPLPSAHDFVDTTPKVHIIRQNVYIGNADVCHAIDVTPTMNGKDIILYFQDQGWLKGWVGSGDWMVFECCQDFGMERPIRTFELVADVMASWSRDKTVNKLMLKLSHLAPLLSRSVLPSSAPTCSSYVEWEAKAGKWSKRWLSLRENNLYLSKREQAKEEFLCSLSNFDAYVITRVIKAPKEFAFALKSTDNLSFFEDKADYMHTFSCTESGGKKWLETILLARSYVLYQEKNVLFTASSTGAAPSALSRAKSQKRPTARPPQPPRPTQPQPLVNVGPADVFEPGSLLYKHN